MHGEAKTQHGLRRAARRRLWNAAIQVYLTAPLMDLKRLAAFLRALRGLAPTRQACFGPLLTPRARFRATNLRFHTRCLNAA